ncbi:unnamed protein product [Cunninghamella blakesleeana]
MAPEVMEQAGYDYKADIWSFGITSIELATGHAPFAKLPPLKVLTMTLSNDPPTLDRESTEHKYSKVFKDMIDSCLIKDPEKRPTAEKLLQHPFFKQSKRKDYLIKTILHDLLPLEQRPRKKISQRQITITKADDEWDFDNDDTTEDDQDTQSMIPPYENDSAQPSTNNNNNSPNPPKRHISFGDVVVRNPPQPSSLHSSPSVVASTTMTTTTNSSENTSTSKPTKKSRFIIEETSYGDHPVSMLTNSSLRSLSPPALSDNGDSKDDSNNTLSDGETTKVGRFHINQSTSRQYSTSDTTYSNADFLDDERNTNDSGDHKSRFEVTHSTSSSGNPQSFQPIPLSRENSSHGSHAASPFNLSRESSSRTRSPLVEKDVDNQSTGESKKIGRFELTTITSVSDSGRLTNTEKSEVHPFVYDSSHSMSASSSTTSPSSSLLRGQTLRVNQSSSIEGSGNLMNQLEELIRYNETQKHLLQEIATTIGSSSNSGTKIKSAQVKIPMEKPSNDDLPATVTYLEQLIQISTKENIQLQKENEALRKEIEQLRISNPL